MSATPLADEFESFGVLTPETIQLLRNKEMLGELSTQDAEPILEQCRKLALENSELEGSNLDHIVETLVILKEGMQAEKHDLYARIESSDTAEAKQESDALLQNL